MINTLDYSKLVYENLNSNKIDNYIVCSMFTRNYYKFFDRFKYSCLDFNLPVAIYEIPDIHYSISMSGSDDMRFSKHRFILSCLERYKCPIVFLDIDTVVCQFPDLFGKITTDFAIYNWLADIENTAYISDNNKNIYVPANEIRYYSQEQMIGTGPVHYWKPTDSVKELLNRLGDYLTITPYASDDHMIDVFFNFRDFDITYTWLPKEYVRFPWHPHVKPVILHPDFPAPEQDRPSNNVQKMDLRKCRVRNNMPQNINGYKLYVYNKLKVKLMNWFEQLLLAWFQIIVALGMITITFIIVIIICLLYDVIIKKIKEIYGK